MIKYIIRIINSLIQFFMEKPLENDINRTAVISFHKLGDSVFSIPALKYLQKNNTGEIKIFCYPENKEIYDLVFKGLHYCVIPQKDVFYKRIFKPGIRKQLNSYNPHVILDFTGTILSASLIIGSKAQVFGLTVKPYDVLFKKWISRRQEPHLIDVFFDALSTVMVIKYDELEKEFAVNSNKGNEILIHPFAGWSAKEWGLEKFIELFKGLEHEGFKCRFIIEESKLSEIRDKISENKVIKTKNIYDLLSGIKRCSVFVGNDSGPLYIANLIGKPTFTIYGPTNPEFSLPFGVSHSFIQKKIHCSPGKNEQYCFTDAGRNGCPSYECMKQLSVKETLSGVLRFLKQNNINADRV